MKRSPILRKSAPKKTNPARRKREFARAYGSKERVVFITRLPCAACRLEGRSVNAHLLGNGGMSRKGHHTTIGPLCADSYDGLTMGCHRMFDEYRESFNRRHPDFDPEKVARETEELWRASLGSSQGGET